jgi:hydroxymethylbilane synthase
MILSVDGKAAHEVIRVGAPADAERIGREAGEEVLAAAGPDFLARG